MAGVKTYNREFLCAARRTVVTGIAKSNRLNGVGMVPGAEPRLARRRPRVAPPPPGLAGGGAQRAICIERKDRPKVDRGPYLPPPRMNDVVPASRASSKLDGQDIYAPKTLVAALRRRVGMVIEKASPFPRSIFDNVADGLRINAAYRTGRPSSGWRDDRVQHDREDVREYPIGR